ncbi:hypothetical protein P4B35_22030 [Pontiellaceae bacterium B12227]|nr:hypothetical protein [Pontiellaceae bacterium B12227]
MMKLRLAGMFVALAANFLFAEPGGSYVLTGKESGVEEIVKVDMAQYPDLYQGESINIYLGKFKAKNDIGRKKYKAGDQLYFPHTKTSKKLSDDLEKFVGEWCNEDFSTRGITRVHIDKYSNVFKVRMWGRCHPKECDWGEEIAIFSDEGSSSLSVTWEKSFCVREQKIVILEDGDLEITSATHYVDKSGRKDRTSTDRFEKGLKHDWSD